MDNISGNCKGYVEEKITTKETTKEKIKNVVNKDKNSFINLSKKINEDYFSLIETCDKLYNINKNKEIYDLMITIKSCQKSIINLKDV